MAPQTSSAKVAGRLAEWVARAGSAGRARQSQRERASRPRNGGHRQRSQLVARGSRGRRRRWAKCEKKNIFPVRRGIYVVRHDALHVEAPERLHHQRLERGGLPALRAKGECVDVGEPCVAEHVVIGHEEERDDIADALVDGADTRLLEVSLCPTHTEKAA